jgi:hypothetical protein
MNLPLSIRAVSGSAAPNRTVDRSAHRQSHVPLVLPRLWRTQRSQERPRAVAGEWPLIKKSRGNLTYADHRHSLGEATGRSQQTIIHVRVQGIRLKWQVGRPTSPLGCVLSRRTRHNRSCLTDSKDDAVQREGGTVVVETQRMKKSRSTSTPAPLLRWIFRRGDRALTCQLERETGHSYAVSLVAHWDVMCAAIETFDAVVAAFRRHGCDCVGSTPRRLDAGGLRSGRVIAAHGRVWLDTRSLNDTFSHRLNRAW